MHRTHAGNMITLYAYRVHTLEDLHLRSDCISSTYSPTSNLILMKLLKEMHVANPKGGLVNVLGLPLQLSHLLIAHEAAAVRGPTCSRNVNSIDTI